MSHPYSCKFYKVSLISICFYRFFSSLLNYEDARLTCHQFGGIIPLPTNQTFFDKLFNDSRQQELFQTTCSNSAWVPVIRFKNELIQILRLKINLLPNQIKYHHFLMSNRQKM